MSPPFYINAHSSYAINDKTRAYASLHKLTAAFGQTLLALKIYSTRHVHYRFSALIASAQTQSTYL